MAKKRIYQVAKEIGVPAEEVIATLRRLGAEVKSNLSAIDEEMVERLTSTLKPGSGSSGSAAKPATKKAAASKPAGKAGKVGNRKPILIPASERKLASPSAAKPATAAPPRPAQPGGAAAAAPRQVARPGIGTPPGAPRPGSPGAARTGAIRPGAGRPAPPRPGAGRPGAPRPGGARPGGARPGGGRPGGGRPGAGGRRRPGERTIRQPVAPPTPPVVIDPADYKDVTLTEGATVKEIAEKIDKKSKDIIRSLMSRGVLATINQPLDKEAAEKICNEFGFRPSFVSFEEHIVHEELSDAPGEEADRVVRAPVVTMMGHVDHGKTSLLDAIRETAVAEREHGGITQHIGAYHVKVGDRRVVFLDTPGHEAFTRMRARGAQVTDIVVLVVAADDGVMPQTIEAIHHAREAKVPIIVAINKIDKPEANLDRTKQALAEQNILVEDWGGDVVAVPVSAKEKTGLDSLIEMLLLTGDMLDLKANPDRMAQGTVLEAKLDRARGPVATVLISDGTLRIGDPFIVGSEFGKVRAMIDDRGERVKDVGPSSAVEVLGLEGVPEAGDSFQALSEENRARQIGAYRQEKARRDRLLKSSRLSLDHLFEQIKAGDVKELRIILKTDVQGSAEVLTKTLHELSGDKVQVKVIHSATGAINDSDVIFASASNAVIVGFNVRPERSASAMAEKEGVDIRLHTVIYNVAEEIRSAMLGLLDPTFKEVYLGRAEVRQTFKVPKIGIVAGCSVQDGMFSRTAQVRLLRDNIVILEGKISSLRRFKEDVSEVKQGFECGIGIEKYNDIKVGDIIEAFKMEKVAAQEL